MAARLPAGGAEPGTEGLQAERARAAEALQTEVRRARREHAEQAEALDARAAQAEAARRRQCREARRLVKLGWIAYGVMDLPLARRYSEQVASLVPAPRPVPRETRVGKRAPGQSPL